VQSGKIVFVARACNIVYPSSELSHENSTLYSYTNQQSSHLTKTAVPFIIQ